jgi:hypothetical protein
MSWVALDYLAMRLATEPPWQEIVKWVATSFIVISAMAISFSVPLSMHIGPFVGFFIGHILWIIVGSVQRDRPIIALNVFFIPIDIYAMMIRL